jgi:uncharacterized membrane protein YeaQ/YmgE (transglycosylase-associated protein family)
MTLVDFLILLVVAGLCGAIAQILTGFSRGGFVVAIALGFIGALIGVAIARGVSAPEWLMLEVGDTKFPIVWSIIGATLFVAVVSLLTPRRTID